MLYRLLHSCLHSCLHPCLHPYLHRAAGALMPAILLSLLALPVQAQLSPRIAAADPLDAKAKVPALVYESALASYPRMAELKPIPWREANDTVTRIGGCRVYAREAQQSETRPPATPPSLTPAAPVAPASPHAGHRAP